MVKYLSYIPSNHSKEGFVGSLSESISVPEFIKLPNVTVSDLTQGLVTAGGDTTGGDTTGLVTTGGDTTGGDTTGGDTSTINNNNNNNNNTPVIDKGFQGLIIIIFYILISIFLTILFSVFPFKIWLDSYCDNEPIKEKKYPDCKDDVKEINFLDYWFPTDINKYPYNYNCEKSNTPSQPTAAPDQCNSTDKSSNMLNNLLGGNFHNFVNRLPTSKFPYNFYQHDKYFYNFRKGYATFFFMIIIMLGLLGLLVLAGNWSYDYAWVALSGGALLWGLIVHLGLIPFLNKLRGEPFGVSEWFNIIKDPPRLLFTLFYILLMLIGIVSLHLMHNSDANIEYRTKFYTSFIPFSVIFIIWACYFDYFKIKSNSSNDNPLGLIAKNFYLLIKSIINSYIANLLFFNATCKGIFNWIFPFSKLLNSKAREGLLILLPIPYLWITAVISAVGGIFMGLLGFVFDYKLIASTMKLDQANKHPKPNYEMEAKYNKGEHLEEDELDKFRLKGMESPHTHPKFGFLWRSLPLFIFNGIRSTSGNFEFWLLRQTFVILTLIYTLINFIGVIFTLIFIPLFHKYEKIPDIFAKNINLILFIFGITLLSFLWSQLEMYNTTYGASRLTIIWMTITFVILCIVRAFFR